MFLSCSIWCNIYEQFFVVGQSVCAMWFFQAFWHFYFGEFPPPHCNPVFTVEINDGAQKKKKGREKVRSEERNNKSDKTQRDSWHRTSNSGINSWIAGWSESIKTSESELIIALMCYRMVVKTNVCLSLIQHVVQYIYRASCLFFKNVGLTTSNLRAAVWSRGSNTVYLSYAPWKLSLTQKHIGSHEVSKFKLHLVSFPGPTQLFATCSMEKQERAWYLFSHDLRIERMV